MTRLWSVCSFRAQDAAVRDVEAGLGEEPEDDGDDYSPEHLAAVIRPVAAAMALSWCVKEVEGLIGGDRVRRRVFAEPVGWTLHRRAAWSSDSSATPPRTRS